MASKSIVIARIGKLPVWHVTSPDRVKLAMTFIRMQEWYESPNKRFFRRVFSLDEYKKWYAHEHEGVFSYAKDWSGFNVPSTAVRAVYERFTEHSREERELFRKLERLGVFGEERFYLIGSSPHATGVLDHELRHALYFTSTNYRRAVRRVLRKFPVRTLSNKLKEMGYGKSVIPDEIQAYTLTGFPRNITVTSAMLELKMALQKIEKEYVHLLPPY